MGDWIKERFGEPSSWAGVAATILGFLGMGEYSSELGPEFWGALFVVISALVSIVKRDQKK